MTAVSVLYRAIDLSPADTRAGTGKETSVWTIALSLEFDSASMSALSPGADGKLAYSTNMLSSPNTMTRNGISFLLKSG
jgi:hypothetical protein